MVSQLKKAFTSSQLRSLLPLLRGGEGVEGGDGCDGCDGGDYGDRGDSMSTFLHEKKIMKIDWWVSPSTRHVWVQHPLLAVDDVEEQGCPPVLELGILERSLFLGEKIS